MSTIKRIGIVRDGNVNESDAMTFQAVGTPSLPVYMCGRHSLPGLAMPEHVYDDLGSLRNYDLLDVADFMYPWTQELALSHPNVVATIWENIPYNYWREGMQDVLNGIKGYIARSELAKETLLLYGIDKGAIEVIPAGVDTELFRPHKHGLTKTVLFAGRLVWEKGVKDLLFASVGQGWKLRFAGDGPLSEWIVDAALALKVDCELLGHVPHKEMPDFFASGDVLVLPSLVTPTWVEQFGIVAIEAMACGVPAVTTDTGAFLEIVPSPVLTIPPCRWDLLRDKINWVLGSESDWLIMRKRMRSHAEEQYSSIVIGERLREFYGRYL